MTTKNQLADFEGNAPCYQYSAEEIVWINEYMTAHKDASLGDAIKRMRKVKYPKAMGSFLKPEPKQLAGDKAGVLE